jgi:hypothetical protein
LTAILDAIVRSANILCDQHQQSIHEQGITHDDERKRLVAALAALFSCTRLVKLVQAEVQYNTLNTYDGGMKCL